MTLLTRRQALALVGGAAAFGGFAAGAPMEPPPPPETLGAAGARAGLLVGAAYGDEIFENDAYARLLVGESRITTLTNAMKFDWLRPHGPVADFTGADRHVAFAESAGLVVRGSAPVWNAWLPDWLKSLSGDELRRLFDAHIDEVVGRYAGRIACWDLVNEPYEPLWYASRGWRRGAWFEAYGKDYIGRAFRRAAAADPSAKLFLNEAALEHDDDIGTSMRPHVLAELRKLLDAGVPLHGFGVQSHLMPAKPHDYRAFAGFLAEVGALGLEIHLTELDLFDDPFPDDVAARDAAVAATYRDYLDAVLTVPQVKAITFWTLSEPYGFPWWVWENVKGGEGRPPRGLLYTEDLKARPARAAALAALAGLPTSLRR